MANLLIGFFVGILIGPYAITIAGIAGKIIENALAETIKQKGK